LGLWGSRGFFGWTLLGILHHDLAIYTSDARVLKMSENQGLAPVVGLPGQQHVHCQYAAVELLDQPDRLILCELERVQEAGHLGQDRFQSGERITLLRILAQTALLLVIRLTVPAVTTPVITAAIVTTPVITTPVITAAISVTAFSLAHCRIPSLIVR
jgi:hypothetical protein